MQEELNEMINKLEKINNELNNKAIEKAIEYLKIALKSEKVGSEGYVHSFIRSLVLKKFKGNVYIESQQTKFSKIGFRPDVIILNEKEIIIIEIETNKKRAEEKLKKIINRFPEIEKLPLCNQRKIKIVFCLSFYDADLIKKIKNQKFEVFILKNNELFQI